MKILKLHSKLIGLQGQIISQFEGDKILAQFRKILDLRVTGQITVSEFGKRIRQASWRIAEDLSLNDLALSSGSDLSLSEELPLLLKA